MNSSCETCGGVNFFDSLYKDSEGYHSQNNFWTMNFCPTCGKRLNPNKDE